MNFRTTLKLLQLCESLLCENPKNEIERVSSSVGRDLFDLIICKTKSKKIKKTYLQHRSLRLDRTLVNKLILLKYEKYIDNIPYFGPPANKTITAENLQKLYKRRRNSFAVIDDPICDNRGKTTP